MSYEGKSALLIRREKYFTDYGFGATTVFSRAVKQSLFALHHFALSCFWTLNNFINWLTRTTIVWLHARKQFRQWPNDVGSRESCNRSTGLRRLSHKHILNDMVRQWSHAVTIGFSQTVHRHPSSTTVNPDFLQCHITRCRCSPHLTRSGKQYRCLAPLSEHWHAWWQVPAGHGIERLSRAVQRCRVAQFETKTAADLSSMSYEVKLGMTEERSSVQGAAQFIDSHLFHSCR